MVWNIWRNGQEPGNVWISNRIEGKGRKVTNSQQEFTSNSSSRWNWANRKTNANWHVFLQICKTVVPAQMELVSKEHKKQCICWSWGWLGKADSSWSYWWQYKFSQIFEVWRWVSSFKQNSDWFVSLIQHQNHTGARFLVKDNQEKFKMTWQKHKGRTNGIQIQIHIKTKHTLERTVKEEESCFVTLYWNKLQSQWGIFLTFEKSKMVRCC